MLTGPSHLLHLHVLRSSFWEDLLRCFPRKQSEANQPVDPWLVTALSEDRCNIHLSSVIGDLPYSPEPFKNDRDDKEWPCSDIGLLPLHPQACMGWDFLRVPWLDPLPLLVVPPFPESCFGVQRPRRQHVQKLNFVSLKSFLLFYFTYS